MGKQVQVAVTAGNVTKFKLGTPRVPASKFAGFSAVVLTGFFWLFPVESFAQSYGCDSDSVNQSGGALVVSATGVDDTENIQCALDAAKANGIPTVRLNKDEYRISHIQISNFTGTLEGTTKDDTVMAIMNDSIDCDAMIDAGQTPAGIKFTNSDARVRFMTYGAETPCMGTQPEVFYLIHFTGGDAYTGCGNDTQFGVVDRVNLVSVGPQMPGIRGIGALGEGVAFETCKDTLLGTFKLNRSLLGYFRVAVQLSVRASGQVDVNFNDFVDNLLSVAAFNASQLLTIQENTILKSEELMADFFGVGLLTNEANAPNTNRLVLHKNVFDMEQGLNSGSVNVGAFIGQDMTIANLSLVATNNTFQLTGNEILGFVATDVSGGLFANNTMKGTADTGLYLEGDETNSSNWAITGNSFGNLSSGTADILLNTGTTNAIIGPGQGATVSNFGVSNTILSSGSPSRKPTGQSSTQATEGKAYLLAVQMHQVREKIAALSKSDTKTAGSNHHETSTKEQMETASNASLKEKLELLIGSSLRPH